MEFTYASYINMLNLLKYKDYKIVNYDDYKEYETQKCCILRHDIDYDIRKAFHMSEIEKENGVKSTWFVIVSGDFYNPFSATNILLLRKMSNNGHRIGLHFDEKAYVGMSTPELIACAEEERGRLENILQVPISSVSMHRPSQLALEANWQFEKMKNSYSREFFCEFKYVSDSRRRWRENVENIINSGKVQRLHILTHAFWYNDEEQDLRSTLLSYINNAKHDRYDILNDNFTDLESVIQRGEIQ